MDQQDEQQPRSRLPPPSESHQPPQPHKCPRCDSSNTKFCYYNNYSLSQPRYFCKACRRYWTHGGTLRNVPVGGGCRKSKRARTSSAPARPATISGQPSPPMPPLMMTRAPYFPTFAAMQTLSTPVGGGGGQFGPNMALLQGMSSLPSVKSPAPPRPFQPPVAHYYPPQQSMIQAGHFGPWTRGITNTGGAASSSATTSSFWSCNSNAAAGNNQAGSSFTPNQWLDNNPGFNPSQ